MAYSYYVYTGNGSTTQFNVPFNYIRKEHIKVYVNYVDTAYTYVNATTVLLAAAPASPLRVEVRRVTPLANVLVDYTDGSTLVAADLDTSSLQSLYNEQELDDNQKRGIFVDDATGLITAGSQRITNVANPVSAQDATTKTYVDTADALKVNKAGDSMSGALAMGSNKITGLGTPTANADAATKLYVDTVTLAGNMPDGDRGDITVSGVGTSWTIDAGAVTSTKILDGTILNADVNASAGIATSKLSFTQAGTGAVARTVDSRLKDMVSVKDFGAVGDGVANDTVAIQAAIDYAYTRATPITLDAQPVVFFPAGHYKTTASLTLRDYASLKGEGKFNSYIDLTGTTNTSAVRSIHGENPTYGSRLVGWEISNLAINGGNGTGAIGLNMRGVGYSTVTDVYALGRRYGLVTSNECYYVTWSQCKFYGDTAAYLQSDGGGNGFSLCDFNAEVICVDIEAGTFDFFAGVMDVNTAGATHIIKLGRASGLAAVSNMFGVYVEGVSATTLTAEIGATTFTSGFFGMHRHNVLGGITNNAGTSFICIMTTGYFNPESRINTILLGDGTITASPRAKIYSPSGNQVNFESFDTPGAFADHVYRTGKPQQGIEFPATQVAVVNANTLDDYEEGTWTPILSTRDTPPTFTYGDRLGKYTKIGNVVHVTATIFFATVTVAGGGLFYLGTLPFAASSDANYSVSGPVGYSDAFAADGVYAVSGGTGLVATLDGAFATGGFVVGRIYFSITYHV